MRSGPTRLRSEEHTSELQSRSDLVCRLLLGKKRRRADGCADPYPHARFPACHRGAHPQAIEMLPPWGDRGEAGAQTKLGLIYIFFKGMAPPGVSPLSPPPRSPE